MSDCHHQQQHMVIKVVSLRQTEKNLIFGSLQALAAILVIGIKNLNYLQTDKNSINHKTLFLILCKFRTKLRHKQAKPEHLLKKQAQTRNKHRFSLFTPAPLPRTGQHHTRLDKNDTKHDNSGRSIKKTDFKYWIFKN
jgi:hypothetical protein